MSETTHRSHRHSHRHKMDDATKFKYRSLKSIERKKKISKWLFVLLCVVAVLMMAAVVAVYMLD